MRVDGADRKRILQLKQTLIIPDIKVNLFSIQRLINKGYLPVYDEVDGKCIIKKNNDNGVLEQYATMTMRNGRAILDCELVDGNLQGSGPDRQSRYRQLPGTGPNSVQIHT